MKVVLNVVRMFNKKCTCLINVWDCYNLGEGEELRSVSGLKKKTGIQRVCAQVIFTKCSDYKNFLMLINHLPFAC